MIRLFKGRRVDPTVDRLRKGDYSDFAERDQLLRELQQNPPSKVEEVGWMALDRDLSVRDLGKRLLGRFPSDEVIDYYVRGWEEFLPVARRSLVGSLHGALSSGWEARLGDYLSHRNDRYRRAAKEILFATPLSEGTRPLIAEQLASGDEKSRRSALQRLVKNPGREDIPILEEHIAHPDESIRTRIIECLADTRDPAYLELFASRIEVESYAVQQRLVEVYIQFAKRGVDVTSYILPLLSGGDLGLRNTAMKILSRMPDQRRVVREFIEYAKTLNGWVRQRALESMSAFGEMFIEPILELFGDPEPTVRSAAIALASTMKADDRLHRALLPLLRDSDWWVRINAAERLAELGEKKAVPGLLELLRDPDSQWTAIDALSRIRDPSCLGALMRLIEDRDAGTRVEVVRALGRFDTPKVTQLLERVCEGDPNIEVRNAAYETLRASGDCELGEEEDERRRRSVTFTGASLAVSEHPPIVQLLLQARSADASDVHISVDKPPMMRIRGQLRAEGDGEEAVLSAEQTMTLIRPILSDDDLRTLRASGGLELCYEVPEHGRYRGSIYVDRRGLNAAFRLIPITIPTLPELGIPPHVGEVARLHQGLVLVVGPSGSGKTTTLAALVNLINETRQSHILTIEDPIEFVHGYKCSLVNQRQLGRDTETYHSALRGALREDPDVIVVGEMRDNETVRLSLEAAETGHLVLGTLNGTTAPRAIDRLINSFSPEERPQTRMMLSDTLRCIISQVLLPAQGGGGRKAVFEILMGLPTVAALIRENKLVLIPSFMQTGRNLGMRTRDDGLAELVECGQLSAEVAYTHCVDRSRFEPLVGPDFMAGAVT